MRRLTSIIYKLDKDEFENSSGFKLDARVYTLNNEFYGYAMSSLVDVNLENVLLSSLIDSEWVLVEDGIVLDSSDDSFIGNDYSYYDFLNELNLRPYDPEIDGEIT